MSLAKAKAMGLLRSTRRPPRLPGAPLSLLEVEFDNLWAVVGGPPLLPEYRFDPPRRWRFDRADPRPHVLIAVEIEGGIQSGHSRHAQSGGFERDIEKYERAQELGWRVFRLTATMLKERPMQSLAPILRALADATKGQKQ